MKEEENPLHRLTDGVEDRDIKGRGADGRLDFIIQVCASDLGTSANQKSLIKSLNPKSRTTMY